ncbi:MAG: hypothetical protein IT515_18710 [Burkholderiales bacterium]|nr:hypothetical protein [Burkholderiales bacterium]
MGRELQRLRRKKAVTQKMDQLLELGQTVLVVHYSCESFYDKSDGKTPRITSIAVRNLSSGQTDSFSIHQIAEEKGVAFDQIDQHYDDLERQMLDRFFQFVLSRQHYHWVHWNMRDVNYGFAAIEHRYRVLGGQPLLIAEDRKFDLARAMIDLYGIAYIGHPRLESLVRKNKITARDFLVGADEAKAFEEKEFVKLHQSTLRKVDIFANLFERASNRTLKTNSTWWEQHGFQPAVIAEIAREHWLITLLIVGGGVLTFVVRVLDLYSIFGASAGSP